MADLFDEGGTDSAARIAFLMETRIAPALERIAAAMERLSGGNFAPASVDPRASAVAEIRAAITEADFARAERLIEPLRDADPDSAEAVKLGEELSEARDAKVSHHRVRLDSARSVNDALAVLEHRDALADLVDYDEILPIDRELSRWLMMLMMKRMRSGTVREDIASLAARGAESFAHLPEGASLKAALPTLRRSAGLCPRCAAPYVGEEDACERCQAGSPKIADLPPTSAPET